MGQLELVPASQLDDVELARLFTAAYEGYLVPFAVDEDTMRSFTAAYDLDRDASRIAVREGAPIGVANLGLRDADAWIGGLGVVPGERRRGTGRALMQAVHDEARARGAAQVWLEVIAENTGARALYEELGYSLVRDLVVWSLVGGAAGVAPEVPAAEAHAGSARTAPGGSPGSETTPRSPGSTRPLGLAVDGAAAVVRVTGARRRRRADRRRRTTRSRCCSPEHARWAIASPS